MTIAALTRCRWMIHRDLPATVRIEQATADPWTGERIERFLSNRTCIGMVIEDDEAEQICGYFLYELRARRIALHRLAVHPAHRRRGLARLAFKKLAGKLSSHRRARIVADVSEDNLPLQLAMRAAGYRAVAVDRDAGTYRFVYRFKLEDSD